ncbi:transposase [Streptosporangium saharense]|uniref:transposase n=1 Tax=Streptosporangium saharense TaxID=1706840 RepID=UPI0036B1C5A3
MKKRDFIGLPGNVKGEADLSDGQWARPEPLLPAPVWSGRPSERTKRQLIDGRRDVPEHYGTWQAVYSLFRQWQRAGVWARTITEPQIREIRVDLTTPHSETAPRPPRLFRWPR